MGLPSAGKRTLNNNDQITTVDPARARDVYTVSRLNREVRNLLEGQFGAVWIEGELSNFARPRSGHWYFSLKDPASQTRCAMFRSRNALVNFTPREGMQVIGRARVTMYEPRGDFQLVVEQLEPAGEGMLRLKFDQLKAKLAAEGLFAAEHKQTIPTWPIRIGVITSASGAALQDILTVLNRRNPTIEVVVYPCAVQGTIAAGEITRAIQTANRRAECEVLIVGRGGGSLEDLWAFNEEILARAIFASQLPIVAAVGHEIDFTIADLVADVRAPTPSASAELCSPDRDDITRTLNNLAQRLTKTITASHRTQSEQLRHLQARLQHPGRRLEQLNQRIDELMQRLPIAINTGLHIRHSELTTLAARIRGCSPQHRVTHYSNRLADHSRRLTSALHASLIARQAKIDKIERGLRAVSPEATLRRGYAIISTENGAVARDAEKISPGDNVSARLARGELQLTVDAIKVPGET